jgi:RNA polymerase sigma factor (sigma-70 family)
MPAYRNKAVAELAAELSAGLVRHRKGYIDAAETLLNEVQPEIEYPLEFVIYRITGFRGSPREKTSAVLGGEDLLADLPKLILRVCESFELRTTDYAEPLYDIPGLARRFNVSTKTVQRWRKAGLVARKLTFPDGKQRVAFLESSAQRFARQRPRQVQRSMRFSQMSDDEREDIIRRARRMADFTTCSLSEISRRIGARSGRAPETIRYTIRRHDREHPAEAVFPAQACPLDNADKQKIYQSFLGGVSASVLARHYNRSRGSIYRIVNEMRTEHLLDAEIDYVYNPQFALPTAEATILESPCPADEPPARLPRPPAGLPPYLRSLYEVPLLSPEAECDLFRRYNFLKYKAAMLREKLDRNRVRRSQLKKIEQLLLEANALKNRIVRANLRLVVSIAKKHVSGGPMSLFELISDGNVSLMRAVEKFDYARGYRFSTYASWAIMRNFARSVPRERFQLDRFATGHDEVLDIAASLRSYDPNETNVPELRESLDVVMERLTPLEREILMDHFGLSERSDAKTLDQLGQYLGISKERVRQIELKALKKLRKIMRPEQAEYLQ